MDFKDLVYVMTIAESKSITAASQKLFISQSGLNQQLIRLEEELGVQLFERSKHHLALTPAGRIYIDNAEKILQINRNTHVMLNDLKNDISGEIQLGLTQEHGIDIFTSIYPEFHSRYPNITFNLSEYIVSEQLPLLTDGKLDLSILMMSDELMEKIPFKTYPIYKEDMILGVPLNHPLAKYAADSSDLKCIDLRYFKDDTFSLIFQNSTMRQLIDPYFSAAGYKPKIMLETAVNQVLIRLVSRGFCCTVIPHSRILANPLSKNCAWFRIAGLPSWTVAIAYRADYRLSNAQKYLFSLAREYGEILEKEFALDRPAEAIKKSP